VRRSIGPLAQTLSTKFERIFSCHNPIRRALSTRVVAAKSNPIQTAAKPQCRPTSVPVASRVSYLFQPRDERTFFAAGRGVLAAAVRQT